MTTKSVLVNFFHPFPSRSRIGAKLFNSIQNVSGINAQDIYELHPDFFIDAKKQQMALVEADLIIMQHPLYWYSTPSLLKEWMDVVLEYGFAYGEKGTALRGKDYMHVISTGGNKEAYSAEGKNKRSIEELFYAFEQTAYLCGMNYLKPLVVYGASEIAETELEILATRYKQSVLEYINEESNTMIEWHRHCTPHTL